MTSRRPEEAGTRRQSGRPRRQLSGEGVELVVVRSGDVVTVYPAATSIPEMIARLDALPRPPSIEERDDEELPERESL